MIEQFHFLRPGFLLLLLPLAAMLWLIFKSRFDQAAWSAVVDSRLMPFILTADGGRYGSWPRWMLAWTAFICIVALAGPTWEKLPQPVYQNQSALVIALDLSRSMDATDIKPSRLARARHKIADILERRVEGQTALLVYAADAFTVTPLTNDVETIRALLAGLETGLMPAQGSRADRAYALALELFVNSGMASGDLLFISDGLGDDEAAEVEALHARNRSYRLSVLAIGTSQGGPIPLHNGGFLKDARGSLVITNLQEQNLRRVAATGGGVFASISADDIDINTLTYLMESRLEREQAELSDSSAELWHELGPGLLLLVLPFAAFAFRRGLLWTIPLVFLLLPPDSQALEWQGLWKNQDQQALELFEQGQHGAAAKQFRDEAWRAAAQYRADETEAALENWQQREDADALYNRGNALAKLGQYEAAIDAYDRLLRSNPGHADARYNKQQIEEWLQQQSQQQQSDQDGEQQQTEASDQQSNDASQSASQQSQPPSQSQSGDSENNQASAQSDDQQESQQSAQQQSSPGDPSGQQPQQNETDESGEVASLEQQMSEQATEQWLRKIPDDPGGLLRRKFLLQYRQRGGIDKEAQAW